MLWLKKGPGNDRNAVTIKLFALPLASPITGQDAKVMICNQPSPWISGLAQHMAMWVCLEMGDCPPPWQHDHPLTGEPHRSPPANGTMAAPLRPLGISVKDKFMEGEQ
jgi:hypothetical protein